MYFEDVEGERGEALRAVFATVRDAMPPGYELTDYRGSPHWVIPLSTFPKTYNKQPLAYVTLMAQKNYSSLYLMGLYSDSERESAFRAAWEGTGRELDMGKSCLRFRRLADVDLGLIADAVAGISVEHFLDTYARIKR